MSEQRRAPRSPQKKRDGRVVDSNKLKRAKLQQKRMNRQAAEELARLDDLRRQGRLVNGVEIPVGAIAADLEEQAPNNSYSPPLFYIDRPFQCVDCGKEEVWTASQQKWYYEIAKGPIYAHAVRCRPCRQKQRRKAHDASA
jgi:hypothetical protein